jgi:hypothetical protein
MSSLVVSSIANASGQAFAVPNGISGNIKATTGNLVIGTAGKGIDFDPAGSGAAANLLDDYEEGTWTAVIVPAGGSVAMNYTVCGYTKIGRVVHITGECNLSSVSSPTGAVTVTGLPFVNSANTQRSSRVSCYIQAHTLDLAPSGVCVGHLGAGASGLSVSAVNNFVGADMGANLKAGSTLIFDFYYHTTT